MDDSFNLARFVEAQDPIWPGVTAELRAGRKASHWMWFVFPQLSGLGRSARAQFYGVDSAAEARAYAAHPVLGARLREAVRLAMAAPGGAQAIFGAVDAAKLRSCLTLFEAVAPEEPVFAQGLARFFEGERCEITLDRLETGRR
jgi:uncharacterized protein (DUF1810 family)